MKSILIALTLLFSTQTFATSYCYDHGLMHLRIVEDRVLECQGRAGMNVSLKPFSKVRRRLMAKLQLFYKTRTYAALQDLDVYLMGLKKNECMDEVLNEYSLRNRYQIEKSIQWCAP